MSVPGATKWARELREFSAVVQRRTQLRRKLLRFVRENMERLRGHEDYDWVRIKAERGYLGTDTTDARLGQWIEYILFGRRRS